MRTKKKTGGQRAINFRIDAIDGLGQGIAKDGNSRCFIAKTLPGETGTARVYKSTKGVNFASLETLEGAAENRIEPACEHFNECPGCHFLHTDYDSELQYKLAGLQRLLGSLPLDADTIQLIKAPNRSGYRNRIQLHYRHKYIGMLDGIADRIQEIPRCQVIDDALKPALAVLYADKSWASEHPDRGHCEIYLKDGEVSTRWNEAYAHGGFTQVNDAMNTTLRGVVHDYAAKGPADTLLDLFAGKGNLSDELITGLGSQRVMVDNIATGADAPAGFYQLDLFDAGAMASLQRREAGKNFQLMVVDPPRKGFPLLAEWVSHYKPKQLIYVSCNAVTLARDLKTLQGKYSITDASLVDLFPGTHHYETIVRLAFKNHTRKKTSMFKGAG